MVLSTVITCNTTPKFTLDFPKMLSDTIMIWNIKVQSYVNDELIQNTVIIWNKATQYDKNDRNIDLYVK